MDTLDIVAEIIRETVLSGPVRITRETTAAAVRGWDSLSHTMIIVNLEDKFAVEMPSERIVELSTVGELVDLIEELRKK